MHWLDIVILVVLGIGAALGFWSGLLWQIARVVSLGMSVYLAIMANDSVVELASPLSAEIDPVGVRVLAFLAVFIVVYLVLFFITQILHKAIKATKLETVDRFFGALLGGAKMAAVVACICAVVVALDLPMSRAWFEQATIAPQFAKGSELVLHEIPHTYRDLANGSVQEVRDEVQKRFADLGWDASKK